MPYSWAIVASGVLLAYYSRPSNDLTKHFPLLADALAALKSRSFTTVEAVAVGPDGIPSFDRLRYRRRDASFILFAFDLVELNGEGPTAHTH
jgi:ATP-dependent DNA ligase